MGGAHVDHYRIRQRTLCSRTYRRLAMDARLRLRESIWGKLEAYRIDRAVVPIKGQPGGVLEIQSRAFHDSYLEVLGEHGIPGLALYLALLLAMFLNLHTAAQAGGWVVDLARGIRRAALIYMISGLFIGVAFQPFLYYLVGASVALREIWYRTVKEKNQHHQPRGKTEFSPSRESLVSSSRRRDASKFWAG